MIEQLLEQAKHQWLNVGAIFFLLIIIPIRNWFRNIALKKIKDQFANDEYIIYEPNFPFIVDFFAPLLFGGMTLELILSLDDLLVGIMIFFALIVLFLVFLTSCTKYVISNKNFYCVPSFKFIYKLDKILALLECNFFKLDLSNIVSIENKICYGRWVLEIKTKDGNKFPRLCFENVLEVESKINNQIKSLNKI